MLVQAHKDHKKNGNLLRIITQTSNTAEERDMRHENLLSQKICEDEKYIMKKLNFRFRLPTGSCILEQAIALCFGRDNVLLNELVNISNSQAVAHLFLGNSIVDYDDILLESLPLLQSIPQSVLFFAYFRLVCSVCGFEQIYEELMCRLSDLLVSDDAKKLLAGHPFSLEDLTQQDGISRLFE